MLPMVLTKKTFDKQQNYFRVSLLLTTGDPPPPKIIILIILFILIHFILTLYLFRCLLCI